jgi:hypothetical protein
MRRTTLTNAVIERLTRALAIERISSECKAVLPKKNLYQPLTKASKQAKIAPA